MQLSGLNERQILKRKVLKNVLRCIFVLAMASFGGSFNGCNSTPESMTSSTEIGNSQIFLESRDVQTATLPPPVLLTPKTNPVYSSGAISFSGECKSGSQVFLTQTISQTAGQSANQSQPIKVVNCIQSTFQLTPNNSYADGLYLFNIYQKDASGMISEKVSQLWTLDSSKPTAPIITNPPTDPFRSPGTLSISGICIPNLLVILSGDDNQRTICSNSQFSFLINKNNDANYIFYIKQQNLAGTESDPTSLEWIRDGGAASTIITAVPESNNLADNATFQFTSTANGSFQCKLDDAVFSSCTSPTVYFNLASGPHQFSVRTARLDGTFEANPPSYFWTQYNYSTVALYHFNSSTGSTFDSSKYSESLYSPFFNGLSDHATTASSQGKFNQGRQFYPEFSSLAKATHNPSHSLLLSQMTVETFLKLLSLPSEGNSFAIASKADASNQFSWEYGLTLSNGNYYFYFAGSSDGSSPEKNIAYSTPITPDAGSHYIAMTWDHGKVTFYYDGSSIGTQALGINTLFDSTADLLFGANTQGNHLDGILDELRISKTVRKIAVPVRPYTID